MAKEGEEKQDGGLVGGNRQPQGSGAALDQGITVRNMPVGLAGAVDDLAKELGKTPREVLDALRATMKEDDVRDRLEARLGRVREVRQAVKDSQATGSTPLSRVKEGLAEQLEIETMRATLRSLKDDGGSGGSSFNPDKMMAMQMQMTMMQSMQNNNMMQMRLMFGDGGGGSKADVTKDPTYQQLKQANDNMAQQMTALQNQIAQMQKDAAAKEAAERDADREAQHQAEMDAQQERTEKFMTAVKDEAAKSNEKVLNLIAVMQKQLDKGVGLEGVSKMMTDLGVALKGLKEFKTSVEVLGKELSVPDEKVKESLADTSDLAKSAEQIVGAVERGADAVGKLIDKYTAARGGPQSQKEMKPPPGYTPTPPPVAPTPPPEQPVPDDLGPAEPVEAVEPEPEPDEQPEPAPVEPPANPQSAIQNPKSPEPSVKPVAPPPPPVPLPAAAPAPDKPKEGSL